MPQATSHLITYLVLIHPHGDGERAVVPLINLEFTVPPGDDIVALAKVLIAIRLQVSPESFRLDVERLVDGRTPAVA